MIIGIDASRANLKRKTGTEWYSFYLIKNLARLDKENKYWLYLNEEPSEELKAAVVDNLNFSFRVLAWPLYSFWTLGRLSWEMIWHRPDVLFIPAHTMPLIYPKKTVNTIHDIAFTRESSLYRSAKAKTDKPILRKLIELVVRIVTRGKYHSESIDYLYWSTEFALNRAKKIITVSHFTKNEIVNVYPQVKKDKIRVVHNGYNNDSYRKIDDNKKISEIKEKYDLEFPYFLYIGRIEKKKNIPVLIEALSILREDNPEVKEKMVLIGDASFGYDEVKYIIEEYNLNEDVIMPGWIDEADLPYILAGASAFIFPSKHEGFGIPLLQAMACGVPVAASDIAVFKEVGGDAFLSFDHQSKEAIAAAMALLIKDQKLREKLISRGYERAEKFSWEKCARETLREITNFD
ncbi:MAG: glycosyltransferase family 1 protein [Patescibacteria group bacterium]|jgi:glycosyltransferase involved in cell wall biosynthesis|nr:glycosyltransferase family 1 protein [Patescibacteria group bacterium]MDD4443878.1 glycosyltransferase family 1 protein [Patescibacteria group bacterium]NCU39634.1 glycosyltransferase family 1 protein [Candidatus Falkowbacteria bacterium]